MMPAYATPWACWQRMVWPLVLSLAAIAPSAGMDAAQPVEGYLQLEAIFSAAGPGAADPCARLLPLLGQGAVPHCHAVHARQGIVMLRWPSALPDQLAVQLQALQRQGRLQWFEIKQGNLQLQSLSHSDAAVLAQPQYWSDLKPLAPEVGEPWFVSDDLRRLRAWNVMLEVQGQVVVAVIDSGVNFQDPALAGVRWHNRHELGANGLDDDGNGYVDDVSGWDFVNEGYAQLFDDTTAPDNDPADQLGHGTAVAQVIRAVVGTGLSERIRLMPLRVAFGLNGSGTVNPAALAEAIYYAADNGAHIINISLGGAQRYAVIASAIQYALGRDVAVVVAAGNSGAAPLFPATEPGVVSVGALDRNGALLASSARGVGVDLYASGMDMGQGLQASGTSFAAPVVSATLALLQAAHLGSASASTSHCRDQRLAVLGQLPVAGQLTDWIAFQLQRSEQARQSSNTASAWQQATANCGAPAASLASLVRKP